MNAVRSCSSHSPCSSLRVECWRLVHGNICVNEGGPSSDHISSLLCHHDGRSVEVSTDDAGHDGGVDDTQPVHTQNARVRVYDRHRVGRGAHLAGAGWVVGAVGLSADKCIDVGVGLDLRAGLDFSTTERVEGFLGKNLSGEFDALPELPNIDI